MSDERHQPPPARPLNYGVPFNPYEYETLMARAVRARNRMLIFLAIVIAAVLLVCAGVLGALTWWGSKQPPVPTGW